MAADVIAEQLGTQDVLADRQHSLAALGVREHAAAEIAGEYEDQRVVVEAVAHEHMGAELERRDRGHAVVAAELHRADAPLVAGGLAEKRLQKQREYQSQDRHDPGLDATVEDKVA